MGQIKNIKLHIVTDIKLVMSAAFNTAAEEAKTLAAQPSNEEMLQLYALFKQASVGDCNTTRPGMLDLKGKAKWDAWNAKKGMAKDAAEAEYIELVEKLKATYGTNISKALNFYDDGRFIGRI